MDLKHGDLSLSSPSFEALGAIPEAFSFEGGNRVPGLSWTGAPEGTASFALVCHDPDAPLVDGFTHWVLYDIPADVTSIPEGGDVEATSGTTSYGEPGWGGPYPPPGHGPHHYFFTLYALDTRLGADAGLSSRELLDRIDGHIIEMARVMGTFES